jgi:putative transposase
LHQTGNHKHLPQRKSIRLKGYDYSQAGYYFITICCQDRICRFGKIENGIMQYNQYGKIAYQEWARLPEQFPNLALDAFQIMPNHMHGIIILHTPIPVGAGFTPAQNKNITPTKNTCTQNTDIPPIPNNINDNNRATARVAPTRVAPTVGNIVGAYKSLVANACLDIFKSNNKIMGKLWQRNYYEHIIRSEESYQRIAKYIRNNPTNWNKDKFHR